VPIKDILEIIIAAGTVVVGIWTVVKYIYPLIIKGIYLYNTGHSIIKGLELKYGSDVSLKLYTQINTLGVDKIVDRKRIDFLETEVGIGIYQCSVDGKCLYANHKLCEMFNLSFEDMLNYGWAKGIISEDRAKALSTWKFAIKNETPYEDFYRVDNDGSLVGIDTKADPVYIDGVLVYYIGVAWQMPTNEYRDRYINNSKL
jgi:PAS domain S-box-containing protein